MSTEPRAQWAIDFDHAVELERIGTEMRRTSLNRRCSVPIGTDEPTRKCTRDRGHDGDHECNMGRDFDGSGDPS